MATVEVIDSPQPAKEVVLRMSEHEATILGALLGNLGHKATTSPDRAHVIVRGSKVLSEEAAANGGYVHNGVLGRLCRALSRAGYGW